MSRKTQGHAIHALFPLTVFFVFVISAVAVLFLSGKLYENTVTDGSDNFSDRTCFSYVVEKIRQNDEAGAISVKNLNGTDCLVLSHNAEDSDDNDYRTYIFVYDNKLRELSCLDESTFDPKLGKDIAPLSSWTVTEEDGLFTFEFIYPTGDSRVVSVGERSRL